MYFISLNSDDYNRLQCMHRDKKQLWRTLRTLDMARQITLLPVIHNSRTPFYDTPIPTSPAVPHPVHTLMEREHNT